jgi:hypothetical protein
MFYFYVRDKNVPLFLLEIAIDEQKVINEETGSR